MKSRQEIIRALLEPARAAADAGNKPLLEALTEIYEGAGHFESPDGISSLIFAARTAEALMPDYASLFLSIASVAQDELLTRHRGYVEELYRMKTESARAWLEDFLGSSALADVIEREIENETHN